MLRRHGTRHKERVTLFLGEKQSGVYLIFYRVNGINKVSTCPEKDKLGIRKIYILGATCPEYISPVPCLLIILS